MKIYNYKISSQIETHNDVGHKQEIFNIKSRIESLPLLLNMTQFAKALDPKCDANLTKNLIVDGYVSDTYRHQRIGSWACFPRSELERVYFEYVHHNIILRTR